MLEANKKQVPPKSYSLEIRIDSVNQFGTFCELLIVLIVLIANSALKKGKSAIPPLFIGPEVLSSASDGAKLFT